MKHLKTFQQIFESQGKETLNMINDYLESMVEFPQLYRDNQEAWAAIIDNYDWPTYVSGTDEGEEGEHLSRKEYESYLRQWQHIPQQKKNFNFFMGFMAGMGDWYSDGYDVNYYPKAPATGILMRPIAWYEEEFGQPLHICQMMKALADEDPSVIDIEFQKI